jgi:predicted transcriptional regulator
VAQVWKELSERRPVARNTVQTMLTRLAEKGWLRARAQANAFYFRAARGRSSAVGRMLRDLIETAFGGSAAGLVQTLLEDRRLSPAEVKRIRKLIKDAEAKR